MIYIPGGVFWRQVQIWWEERNPALVEDEGCVFCGKTPVCYQCGRCYDPNCNAGCIYCRTFPPPPRTCPCCGQETH